MTPTCSSISRFPSAQTGNSRNDPTAAFPEDSIPAHAGKTPSASMTSAYSPAHPRSRGENRFAGFRFGRARGSSPLTRGKQTELLGHAVRRRLIPAHAGKTGRPQGRATVRAAHPRSRGENARIASLRRRLDGSSPLTRGKHSHTARAPALHGLIPAHAGKTSITRMFAALVRAHPRSRGENRVWGRGPQD